MMPRKRKFVEDALQKQVIEYLRLALPDAVIWATPNQAGTRTVGETRRLKGMGVLAGFPDICILHETVLTCIELKAPGRSLSDVQKELHPKLRAAGAIVHTCKSLEQVQAILELEGFQLKARAAA